MAPARKLGPQEIGQLLLQGEEPSAVHENGRILVANAPFAELLGYSLEELTVR